jgi:cystathionine beta-lyase/cystathionine gamma-synthase
MQIVANTLTRFGVTVTFVPIHELAAVDRLGGPRAKALWFESPINPSLRCVDIAAIAQACRARGLLSIIDSTFASPANQQPIRLGVDLVMHSASKYLNGHSDLLAGALVGSRRLIDQLQGARRLFGGVLDPASAYALARGMKTLGVRVARQNETARRVAEWCERDPRVARVYYPGLTSHPDHDIARRQMTGFGGMVTIDARGGYEAACRAYDRFRIILRAASLGGVETLCSLPVLTSQFGMTDDQLAAMDVTRGMMRLSIGLEHPDDLIADLDHALT